MKQLFQYNIYLIGFMGCGKSTVSAAMYSQYGMDIVEMDQIITVREGMSINEIFRIYGEPYFREIETKLLVELQSEQNKIVSCGGGVPMKEQNVQEMKKNGKIVLLTAKPETILERVKASHDRPLLENNKNAAFIAELMEKRQEKYEAAADIIVETDGKSAEKICEEIINRLLADDNDRKRKD